MKGYNEALHPKKLIIIESSNDYVINVIYVNKYYCIKISCMKS